MLHSLTRCSEVLKRNLLLASCYTHTRDSNHSHSYTNTYSWNQLVVNVITFCSCVGQIFPLLRHKYCTFKVTVWLLLSILIFLISFLPCRIRISMLFQCTLKSKEVMISLRCSMWNILCLHTVYLLCYIIYKWLFKIVYFCICIYNYLILLWQQ